MGLNCLKSTEPLRGGSLLFTTKFPEFPSLAELIWSTSEGWQADSTLDPPSCFEHRIPGLGIQHLNHQAIASYGWPTCFCHEPKRDDLVDWGFSWYCKCNGDTRKQNLKLLKDFAMAKSEALYIFHIKYFVNPFQSSFVFIEKPAIWFTQQIKWLVSVSKATLGWHGLSFLLPLLALSGGVFMTLWGGTSCKTILAKGFIIGILQGLGSAPAFPVYFTYSGGGEKVVEVVKHPTKSSRSPPDCMNLKFWSEVLIYKKMAIDSVLWVTWLICIL